ncbi:MAG: protein-disulfide reductase DsbD family protein [Planctomycetota bacterium]
MRAILSRLSLFGLLLGLCVPVAAQDTLFQLKAAFDPPTAKAGDTVKLVLTAEVDPAWHAYGTKEKGNQPVSFDTSKLTLGGLELAGEPVIPPGEPTDTPLGRQYRLPESFEVTLALKVPAGQAAGEVEVKGGLGYQICDENMCMAPTTAKFAAKLTITGAAAAKKPAVKPRKNAKVQVTARFEPATAHPGETVKLVVAATVKDGWHAYGSLETGQIPVALPAGKLVLHGLAADGEALVPPGVPTDYAGGKQYRLPHEFEVAQKITVPAGQAPGEVAIEGALDYQVCDENGCDLPTDAPFAATLTVVAGGQEPPHGVKPGLKLEPDAKFTAAARFEPSPARAGETVRLIVHCTVDPEYHAYGTLETENLPVSMPADRLKLGPLVAVGEADVPPGEPTDYAGTTQYRLPHEFDVVQTVTVPAGQAPGEVAVEGVLHYAICDENHCEPPADTPFTAKLMVEAGAARAEHGAKPPKEAPVAKAEPQAADAFGGSLWALILACIGGGLFALAMPCTYPMIPITFSFFTKQAEKRHGSVLGLALIYGLGIILMFTLVGVALSAVIVPFVNHWITNAIIGVVFLLFAFVLFGWVNLNPPRFLQDAAGSAGKVGGVLGVFLMGAALVVSSFTCTAPIVGSLIANVAKYGQLRVGFGMAVFGLTMAIPFVFLSLMPTKVKALPRSGEWMETLKVSLGFIELAATLKFVSNVDLALNWNFLNRELFLMLCATIFALWALYLFGILRKQGTPNEGVGAGRMATGMFASLFAAYLFFGAMGYRLDFYTTGFVPPYSAKFEVERGGGGEHASEGHTIVYDNAEEAKRVAIAEGKLLLYNFTGFI